MLREATYHKESQHYLATKAEREPTLPTSPLIALSEQYGILRV